VQGGRCIEGGRRHGSELDEVVRHAGHVYHVVPERGKAAVGVTAERHELHNLRLVADIGVHLRPGEHQLHRPAGDPRRRGSQHLMRPDIALSAEAAARVRADHAHILRRDVQHGGEHELCTVTVLDRVVAGQPVTLPMGECGRRLYRIVVPRRLRIDGFVPMRRRGQPGLEITLAELRLREEVAGLSFGSWACLASEPGPLTGASPGIAKGLAHIGPGPCVRRVPRLRASRRERWRPGWPS
jgi:hypothetical protein